MSSRVKVTDTDKGYKKLVQRLIKHSPSHAAIGVLGEAGQAVHTGEHETKTPPTVLDVAIWNEFGLGVPERSFLRETVDLNRESILERLQKELGAVIDGTRSREDALARVGIFVEGLVKQRIADGIDPPNSPVTIERKGSDKPLIDKGQLRSSIASKVR